MTISYNIGIPAASHNPSNDQPNMLQNNDNIPALISVDHVNFNTAGSGQHLRVTFNSNNVPSFPLLNPTLFTNNDAFAIPQLFYYTGSAPTSANQYTLTANGSALLFGGIIAKWGVVTLAPGFDQDISFGSLGLADFPNACFTVVANINTTTTPPSTTTGDIWTVQTNSFTKSKFHVRTSTTSKITSINFIAMGN